MFCVCRRSFFIALSFLVYCNHAAFNGRYIRDLIPLTRKDGRLSIFDKSCSYPCYEEEQNSLTFDMPLMEDCPPKIEADQDLIEFLTVNPCHPDGYILCSYCVDKKNANATLHKYCQMQPKTDCDSSKGRGESVKDSVVCHDCLTVVTIHASTDL